METKGLIKKIAFAGIASACVILNWNCSGLGMSETVGDNTRETI